MSHSLTHQIHFSILQIRWAMYQWGHDIGNSSLHATHSWLPSWFQPYWILWIYHNHTDNHQLWNKLIQTNHTNSSARYNLKGILFYLSHRTSYHWFSISSNEDSCSRGYRQELSPNSFYHKQYISSYARCSLLIYFHLLHLHKNICQHEDDCEFYCRET